MKSFYFSVVQFLLFAVLFLLIGCDPAPKKEMDVQEIGKKSAISLLSTLKKNLVEQIKTNGTVAAMNFCSEKAVTITSEVESKLTGGIKVKRLTDQPRNPANAPNESEKKALQYFTDKWSEKPSEYVVENDNEYHYYKPLAIAGECLQCHGPKEQLSEDVKNFLAKKYPQDKATGYQLNDFRGVVKVTISKNSTE